MIGVMKAATKEVTTAVNAAPTATATARSTTLPRRMKARNSWSVDCFSLGAGMPPSESVAPAARKPRCLR